MRSPTRMRLRMANSRVGDKTLATTAHARTFSVMSRPCVSSGSAPCLTPTWESHPLRNLGWPSCSWSSAEGVCLPSLGLKEQYCITVVVSKDRKKSVPFSATKLVTVQLESDHEPGTVGKLLFSATSSWPQIFISGLSFCGIHQKRKNWYRAFLKNGSVNFAHTFRIFKAPVYLSFYPTDFHNLA